MNTIIQALANSVKLGHMTIEQVPIPLREAVETIDEEKVIEEPREIEVPLGGDSERLDELTETINILIDNEE